MLRPRERAQLAARVGIALLSLCGGLPAAAQQQQATLLADLAIYGDNTEFFNPFRDGETLLGAAGTLGLDIELTERATLRGGLFFNHRYGSARFAEQWRPVISLTVETGASRFVFGTLDTVPNEFTAAPDLGGPHGLLPPLQVETLAFTRPHEGGIQWQVASDRLDQDAWINWQRLNTEEHRERFDAGVRGRVTFGAGAADRGRLPVPHRARGRTALRCRTRERQPRRGAGRGDRAAHRLPGHDVRRGLRDVVEAHPGSGRSGAHEPRSRPLSAGRRGEAWLARARDPLARPACG